jgi:rod shape-determining protein MreC
LSLVLLYSDRHYHGFAGIRNQLGSFIIFTERVVNSPVALFNAIVDNFTSKQALIASNEQLRTKLLLLNTDLQRLSFVLQENSELRTMLHMSKQITGKVLTVGLVTQATSNFTQHILIDRGEQHGIYVGQSVLDAYGLLGQVVIVKPTMSIVMLITNNKSAVPVIIVRSGLQTIAVGTGDSEQLELANVPETADVKVGDILVTSGLGKVFPAGYQVGVVKEIRKVLGGRFMKIFVIPKAHLNKSRHLFLVAAAEGLER